MDKIVRQILTSRVYEAAVETPLEHAPNLSEATGNRVLLKREDLQPVHSFKLRGAYNRIVHLSAAERKHGIITASAGNHAQGVAYSAGKLGIKAVIVMPCTTPEIKVTAVKRFGVQVILHGDNYSDAAEQCQRLMGTSRMIFVHPFDDDLVIAGQGTIAVEILRQSAEKVAAVFVPIGGGGLMAGIATYIKTISPETLVIGVEPDDSDAMAQSIRGGHRVSLDSVGIFADGVAVRRVGRLTYALCRRFVDEIITVSTDEICSAIKSIHFDTRCIVEPAGALAVAGLLKYAERVRMFKQTLVAINSGANINFERLGYVAERAQIGEKREALFAVTIPEKPGALKRFCLDVVRGRSVTELNYRLSSREKAEILIGIAIRDDVERAGFTAQMSATGFPNRDLTENELAKTHIRHMVGGRSPEVFREVIYRFWFPERAGALINFLDAMSENWNISLFHYRMQGSDYGSVLIGLEIPPADDAKLLRFLNRLGYRYLDESDNVACRLFM